MKVREVYSIKTIAHMLGNASYFATSDSHRVAIDTAIGFIKEQEEEINLRFTEIERLKEKDLTETKRFMMLSENYIRAEAIKEFSERLKEKADVYEDEEYYFKYVTTDDIDNLVKEMVGADNG